MIHFPDKTLKRYTYTKQKTDIYGANIHEYEYNDDILVDFQNENNSEVREQYGVEKDNLYKIYIDKNTTLNSSDELEDEDGNRYSIIGEVMEYNHFHNYKKVHLIRKRRNKE